MSTPSDPRTPQPPGVYGPDDPTIQMRALAEAGDPDARADAPTLTDITHPSLPAMRPSQALQQPSASIRLDRVASMKRRLLSQDFAILLAACLFVFAFVLVVTALALRPILSLLPNSSTAHTAAAHAATATPLPTVTPTPSPTLPATAATFAALDTTTQGNWQGAYGNSGFAIAGDTQQLPAAIQVASSGVGTYTWAGSTDDARALVKPENPSDRIAACWSSFTSFSIDINITDGQTYQLALYVLDWDQLNRVETVSIVDPSSGAALDTRPVSAFGNGEYLVWQVRGHVTIQVINAAGSLNSVVSGLFFASAAPA